MIGAQIEVSLMLSMNSAYIFVPEHPDCCWYMSWFYDIGVDVNTIIVNNSLC